MKGFFFFSSRRRHTRYWRDWSSDVCSSDLDETQTDHGDVHPLTFAHGRGRPDGPHRSRELMTLPTRLPLAIGVCPGYRVGVTFPDRKRRKLLKVLKRAVVAVRAGSLLVTAALPAQAVVSPD